MAEAHPPSPKHKGKPFLLRRLRVKPAMTAWIVFRYVFGIVHLFFGSRIRSILSVIFKGKEVSSSNCTLLYFTLAE